MKFGIVGTNFVSDSFMEGVALVEACEVVAVCSGRRENAVRFSEAYQIPHVFSTYQEMFEANLIEAVYIATPNSMHFEQAKYFLERRIPVFCEKPMASNVREVKELFQMAEKYQTYLHDAIIPMYSPNFQLLKEALVKIGKVHRAVISFEKYSSRYGAYLRGENPTTFRRELSNGAFMDLGVYTIADTVALFGVPKNIYASATLLDTKVDGMNTSLFQYDNFDVILLNSKISNTKIQSEIQGEHGIIQFYAPSNLVSISLTMNGKDTELLETTKISPFKFQLDEFIKQVSLENGDSPLLPQQLSIDIYDVLTRCRLQCGITYLSDMQ